MIVVGAAGDPYSDHLAHPLTVVEDGKKRTYWTTEDTVGEALAALGVAKLQRFIPRSVMIGFVNALAILIFAAQIPHLLGVPWLVYPMVAAGIAIMVFFQIVTGGTLMLVAAAGVFALVAIGLYAAPFRTATAPV